jgi:hypothetical protein
MTPPAPGALPDLAAFAAREGRLPRLGDTPAPWHYRGWLLPYLVLAHARVPAVADRWGYHLRTLQAGRLLDEPIPPVAFGPPDNRVFALLREWSGLAGRDGGGWGDFCTLLDWLCWALALGSEEPHLAEQAHERLYRGVNLVPLLERPYDYLGDHAASGRTRGWNPRCFYATPHPVAECLARMAFHDAGRDGRDVRTLTVLEPAVGSGRILLHAANYSLALFGNDIDPVAVAMCKLNGALYAPWISFPLPEAILGRRVEPPPAPLPGDDPPPPGVRVFRADDRGQGLLFG